MPKVSSSLGPETTNTNEKASDSHPETKEITGTITGTKTKDYSHQLHR